jgi:hypothetical protein
LTIDFVGKDPEEWGFFYSKKNDVTSNSRKRGVIETYTTGTKYFSLTQLEPDTTYYFKPYIKDANGYILADTTGNFTTPNDTKIQTTGYN